MQKYGLQEFKSVITKVFSKSLIEKNSSRHCIAFSVKLSLRKKHESKISILGF